MEEDMKNKMIKAQKDLIANDEIIKNLVDKTITKEMLYRDLDEYLEDEASGPIKRAPFRLCKSIENLREAYDSPDLDILGCERYDNARDAQAKMLSMTSELTEKELIFKSVDDGTGIKEFNFKEYLALGGSGKDRLSEGIGLAGDGAKLLATIMVYGIVETKLEDEMSKAILWFLNFKKDEIRFLDYEPQGKITTPSGTYEEIHILKEATSNVYDDEELSDELYNIFQSWYRSHLLSSPGEVKINGLEVVAEDFPLEEKKHKFETREGYLIITKDALEEEPGLVLNICGKDIRPLSLSELGIDLPSLENRVTGFVKDDRLKRIIKPSKEDINKRVQGSSHIWHRFYDSLKKEITKFLRENGYLGEVLSGEDMINAEVSRDLKYLIKNSKTAKELFDMFKTGPGVTKTKGTGTGKEAYTEKREGRGRIEGLIVFADETEKKGFGIDTPVKDFFEGEKQPKLLGEKDKAIIKIYKKELGGRLIRLTDDVSITGPSFIIEDIPIDTDIVVKAYTTYGNPRHTDEPLGRPKTLVHLTTENPFEYVIIPIGSKEGVIYRREPHPEEVEYAYLETDDEGKRTPIVNTAHPIYKINERQGDKAKYTHELESVIYAVCSSFEDEDERKKKFKELLGVVDKRWQ